jgi:hypothetical protein
MYFLFACAAFRVEWTPARLRGLLACFILGGLAGAAATYIDWFGIIDIPRVNEDVGATRTTFGYIPQIAGPFPRRSAMAAYYSLLIPLAGMLMQLRGSFSGKLRAAYLATAILCAGCLMLSHNRSGLLSSIMITLFVALVINRSPRKLVRLVLACTLLTVVLVWAVETFFHDQLLAYEALLRFGEARSADAFLDESDYLRVLFLERAMTSMITNPVGNGYSYVTGTKGYPYNMDPHGNITQIIWAGGVFGLCWLPVFAVAAAYRFRVFFLRRNLANAANPYGIAITAALLGWAINGLAHTTLDTGVAWLFFGVLAHLTISPSYRVPREGGA